MRKYVGYLFVILITGSIIGQVTVQGSYAMAMDDSNPYEEFWKILYREAELVVKVENGNISAIQELIENSRKGEENAANISSLTWTSLKELESSGVKMYYTEEELRKMAEDIAENGLPEDTVRALKEQGWSDQEIKALEDYIAKNKDNITGDFNMSEFLMNFSRAFVKVGFKYAEYESWALEKWKWEGKANFTGSLPSNEGLNPFLINELSDVRLAYSTNNMKGLLKAINELSSKMYEIFKYEMVEYSSLPSRFGQLKNRGYVTFYKGGFVVITTRNIRYFPNYTEEVTEYYWPTALKAYNLTRQIYVIVKAISMGNGDQELRKMLKDKMEELREALVVYINKYERKPWRDLILLRSSPVTRGRLIISKEVVIDEATPDEVKYRIKITMEAHNNDVRDIEIEVDDTTSGSSDKGSVDYLTMGESKTWFSKQFSIKPSDTTVKIEGKIKITYTPVCGDIPQRSGQSLDECTEPRTISDEYSKVIEVTDSIDPSKVTFNIIASKKKIREGDSVDFYIEVTNDNNIKIEGKYLLEVSVPQGRSSTPYPKKFHGNVSVDPRRR
ncbi:hypothetical protein [Pyrococcus horikoshii]|uniref:Uncharacterized protein n=1 Tax=Pyrococcus horikoshii (strain ATCC 700860 / DSM 12428 / JCM 9974 / NBRC 100139 / OT-3) TaxID=70601 RepID=O58315_PYRHO|nr:hypothetical protein [Pyrococcus horikoshii]BAA29691.1 558aa long hypothetical protein [Pyrococcus horikoshii OT3]